MKSIDVARANRTRSCDPDIYGDGAPNVDPHRCQRIPYSITPIHILRGVFLLSEHGEKRPIPIVVHELLG